MGALKVAKTKGTIETELKKIERCPLLILYDLFLVPLDAKECPILLDIIEDRHECKSIIIPSQLPVAYWYDAIGEPTVADARLDQWCNVLPDYYGLDMVVALAFRIQSLQAEIFRKWILSRAMENRKSVTPQIFLSVNNRINKELN